MKTLKDTFVKQFELTFTKNNIKDKLLEASEVYYNTGDKVIGDELYDELRNYYESKFEALPVGAPVTIGKALELSHSYSNFAGTLHKSQNMQDVAKWITNKKLKGKKFMTSIKADGNSITVEYVYRDGELRIDAALTRGENGKGKDLTEVFKANEDLVPKPDLDFDCAVGYEAITFYKRFDNLLTAGGEYKNPRSAVSGILSNSGLHFFKYLDLLPIRIKAFNEDDELTRLEYVEVIKKMRNGDVLDFQILDYEGLEKLYLQHEDHRLLGDANPIDMMYDGLVIEVLEEDLRTKLGYTGTEPNFITALKFSPQEKETTLLDIEWSCEGHSGRLTPKAIFEPVIVRGNTYVQCSLANITRFESLNLRKGDQLLFALRNDTLGYVDKLENTFNAKNKKPLFVTPEQCPSCYADLEKDVFLECVNPDCDLVIIGQQFGFLEKMGVKGIGRATLDKLGEVYDLDYTAWVDLDVSEAESAGLGKKTAQNLVIALNQVFSKPIKPNVLLGSMGIPSIGRDRAKLFTDKVPLSEILKAACSYSQKDDFVKLFKGTEGLGEKSIITLFEWLVPNYFTLANLIELLEFEEAEVAPDLGEDFVCLSFCHTGDPSPFVSRDELTSFLNTHGHKLVSGVSKKTNFLVSNATSNTVKFTKARSLGIPIISVTDMMKLVKGDDTIEGNTRQVEIADDFPL